MNVFGAAQAMGSLPGVLSPALRALEAGSNSLWPNQLPNPEALYRAWRAGQLNDADMRIGMLGNGVWPPAVAFQGADAFVAENAGALGGYPRLWSGVWNSTVSTPGVGELLALIQQKQITQAQFDEMMKLQGWWWGDYRNFARRIYADQIPDPQSLVSFGLREAWDPAVVARFQYDEEFPRELAYFMGLKGADGSAEPFLDDRRNAGGPTWSQMYWRTHWTPLSPTRAFEMFQRLRANRIDRFGAQIQGLRPFTFQDLEQVLKINDYAKPFRSQLAAIAYRKPRLVDINRFFKSGSINEEEAYQLHLDVGYDPTLARQRTDWLVKQASEQNTGVSTKANLKIIAQLYELGRLDAGTARQKMLQILTGHGTEDDRRQAMQDRPDPTWRDAQRQVDQILASANARTELAMTRKLLAAWRKQFLKGMVSESELRQDMSAAGMTNEYVDNFVRSLQAELASGRLMLSTSQIRGMVIDGILSLQIATRYLANLGWKEPERGYLLAQLEREIEIEQARVADRQAQTMQEAEEARMRQVRAAERARAEAIRKLNRQASPAALVRYFVRGIIRMDELERELDSRGFTDEARKRIEQEARQKREEYLAKRAARRAAPGAGPAPGGNNGQLPTPPAP